MENTKVFGDELSGFSVVVSGFGDELSGFFVVVSGFGL